MEGQIQGIQNFDKDALLANQYTIGHMPERFVLDFKAMVPQFLPTGEPQMVLTHSVILFDPYFAKQFLVSLQDNIAKYESSFGKIKKPEAVVKAEKDAKNSKQKVELTTSEKIAYVG